METRRTKAVCLLSGGLDSGLAAKLMQEQGIEILAISFVLPFGDPSKPSAAVRVAESLGVDLRTIPLGEDYLEVIKNPRHGYGGNMNPCIDCHIHMLAQGKQVMMDEDASFVVTGEVVGQRPMSQRLDTLRVIEKESGLEGLLLRPLSAQLLKPTVPETEGWVDRDSLLAISGRSRKELLRLAKDKGLEGYSTPAGGCLLTDPGFSARVRDLLDHDMLSLDELRRLTVGRHFRLPKGSKLIVGRNHSDNEVLLATAGSADTVLTTPECPGPVGILVGDASEEEIAASIVARYSDGRATGRVKILTRTSAAERMGEVSPLDAESVRELMI
jgi:tRNA U34 2-thiouridine synthase MnmA/TrmU